MYRNKIWRLDSDWLAAYVEDPEARRKIRRSFPDFEQMAEYRGRDGKLIAIQYRVRSKRIRSAKRLLNTNISSA